MRRKEGAEQKSVQDMAKLIKEFDPNCLPLFVAKDLNKIPPVSFNYIDSTSFLKEIAILRSDVASIKAEKCTKNDSSSSVSEIEALKTEIEEVKSILKGFQQDVQNSGKSLHLTGRTLCTQEQEQLDNKAPQSPASAVPNRGCTRNQPAIELSRGPVAGASSKQSVPLSSHSHTHSSITRKSRGPSADARQLHAPSYRDMIMTGNLAQSNEQNLAQKDEKRDDSFIVVEHRKRKKLNNLTGTAKGPSILQIAELTSFVYISRLKKTTTVDDVKEYLKGRGEECMKIDLLTQRHDTDFCSYKLTVPRQKLDIFLSNEFWPEGIKFRLFREHTARGNKPT